MPEEKKVPDIFCPKSGKIDWIGIRPHKQQALISLDRVEAIRDLGLEGDHYNKPGGKRQITLIQAEHLPLIAGFLRIQSIDPLLTRRNLVISGINLRALEQKKVKIGKQVILQLTGPCHPCYRMEENLGVGGYTAMIGYGGMTARVLKGGYIELGDKVELLY